MRQVRRRYGDGIPWLAGERRLAGEDGIGIKSVGRRRRDSRLSQESPELRGLDDRGNADTQPLESFSRRWKLVGVACSQFKSRLCQPVGPISSPSKGMARAHRSRVGQFAVEWPRLIRNFNPLVRQASTQQILSGIRKRDCRHCGSLLLRNLPRLTGSRNASRFLWGKDQALAQSPDRQVPWPSF